MPKSSEWTSTNAVGGEFIYLAVKVVVAMLVSYLEQNKGTCSSPII